jgi:polysaccharide export outer membrane protein
MFAGEPQLRQLPNQIHVTQTSLRSSTGVVLKSKAHHSIGFGFFLIAVSGSLLGQVPASGQANRGLPAATVATSPAQPPTPSANKLGDDTFVIGNDDVLGINVWKEPDFSRSIQVRSDGKISLPLLGEVQAAGRTPLQLEQDIATKLRDYITKPEVTVMVEQINSKKFNILGQVTKPGSYSLALAPTVVDAIAVAGGPRDFAKQKSIYILRQNPGGGQTRIAFNYKDFLKGTIQNVKLEPHDTVVVP